MNTYRMILLLLLAVTQSPLVSCRQRPLWSDACPVPIQQSVYDPSPCDCEDIYIYCMEEDGVSPVTGVYTVYYGDPLMPIQVYCDFDNDGGKWTVFQRRFNGVVDFFRGWDDYVGGFGNPQGEYWLGLQYMHWLMVHKGPMVLRIELVGDPTGSGSNENRSAIWTTFNIAGPEDDYRLTIGGYISPDQLGDSMDFQNGGAFSTLDNDNDNNGGHCSQIYRGAWWYTSCHYSNLNGMYLAGAHTSYAEGMDWRLWGGIDNDPGFGYEYSYLETTMQMRKYYN